MKGNAVNALKIPAWGMFIISMGVVLYLAKSIFIPIVLAIIASFLLAPAVNHLKKLRIPSTVGSFLILLLFSTLMVTAINYLADPVGVWIERLPAELRHIEDKLFLFKSSIANMRETTDKFGEIAATGSNTTIREVVVSGPNILFILLDNTQSFLVSVISFVMLLYFLLAFGDSTINSANQYWGSKESSATVIRIVQAAQQQVGHYLLLITAINIGLGVLVAEEFVLPLFVGKLFIIDPILIFLFILFLGWLWGITGIFMAVPLLMIMKIVFDQIQARDPS